MFTLRSIIIIIIFFIISDEIHSAKQKSKADADFYKAKQEAAANSLLLTKEYLELKKYETLANNNKIYFGESIPKMFVTNDILKNSMPCDSSNDDAIVKPSTKN